MQESYRAILLSRMEALCERYGELEAYLSSPAALTDMSVYTERITEMKGMEEAVVAYRDYLHLLDEIKATGELSESEEGDLALLAQEELKELLSKKEPMEDGLLKYIVPKDPMDGRNVIVEIRAGAGGEEAALFAADLYRMYTMYASRVGFTVEPMYANETELGGFREIDFLLKGKSVYSKMKYESGVHRVQRVPRTESQGKIQTSTVTVAVLPEVDEVEVTINPKDIKIESCKSSGAGGQHINKTESAVRLTHLPTGIVVECQEERSQFKNKDKAMKLLEAKLYRMEQEARDQEIASNRRSQVGTGERCERIRTYNFPQGRVTDHRVGVTLYNIDRFLNGDIEEILYALTASDAENALKDVK